MSRTKLCSVLMLAVGVAALVSTSVVNAQTHRPSTLGRYHAYVTTSYNSTGQANGIRVYYSIGALRDNGQPSHYGAVCVNENTSYSPCIEANAKAWSRQNWNPVGYWVSQFVPLNCNSTSMRLVQVHQPYVASWSTLNFDVYGGSPYRIVNGYQQLFYSGSSDPVSIQVRGNCTQIDY
jgi:hypothetical protein